VWGAQFECQTRKRRTCAVVRCATWQRRGAAKINALRAASHAKRLSRRRHETWNGLVAKSALLRMDHNDAKSMGGLSPDQSDAGKILFLCLKYVIDFYYFKV
jgi:hypothetical protein